MAIDVGQEASGSEAQSYLSHIRHPLDYLVYVEHLDGIMGSEEDEARRIEAGEMCIRLMDTYPDYEDLLDEIEGGARNIADPAVRHQLQRIAGNAQLRRTEDPAERDCMAAEISRADAKLLENDPDAYNRMMDARSHVFWTIIHPVPEQR